MDGGGTATSASQGALVAHPRKPEKMHIRSVDPETAKTFALNAGARGMTQAQYLRALLLLHEVIRVLVAAHPTWKGLRIRRAITGALADFGLEQVTR